MADLNEEREILLPEDDDHQVLDSPSENHELEVSRHVEGSVPSESAQGICAMSCYKGTFWFGVALNYYAKVTLELYSLAQGASLLVSTS